MIHPIRHTLMLAILGIALAFGTAIAAHGEEAPKLDVANTVTIEAIDHEAKAMQVADMDGVLAYVGFDDKTAVFRGGEPMPLEKLGAGDRIVVEARAGLDEGTVVADRITVVIDPPMAATE